MTKFIPMKHQLEAQEKLENMERRGSGGFLCDAMGLGKTASMSMFLNKNGRGSDKWLGRPDLIVCPFSLLTTWEDWLTRTKDWGRDDSDHEPKICVYHGSRRKNELPKLRKYDFVVTTYATISTGELDQKKWGRVILDESHNIKNGLQRKAPKCAKAAFKIGFNAIKRFCISGTPMNNRIKDIAAQALFIGDEPYNDPSWWKDNGEDERVLSQWRNLYVIRRTKDGMLEAPSYHDVYVDPTQIEENLVNALRAQAAEEFKSWKKARMLKDNNERMRLQGQILGLIQKLRITSNSYYSGQGIVEPEEVIQNNAKVEKMINDLDRLVDKDPKKGVVFFSQFTSFLEVFEQVIEYAMPGVEVIKFYGSMNKDERDMAVERFNTQRNPRVILVSLMAGGCGLSLHHGSRTVCLAEPYYNPFAEQQAEERVHRLGQEEKVVVFRYYMKNSVENWIDSLKQKKLTLAGNLELVKSDMIPLDFNFDDIAELFQEHVAFSSTAGDEKPKEERKKPDKASRKPRKNKVPPRKTGKRKVVS